MFPGNFMMGGWWIIFPIIGIVLMIAFMVLVFSRGGFRATRDGFGSSNSYQGEEPETALAILKKRYARGEVSKEEFEEIKNDLWD